MSDCDSQLTTLETKRGDALELTFVLSGFASYAGLAARAQLRVACGDDVDFRSRLQCGALAGTFTIVCDDRGDGTAAVIATMTSAQTAEIPPGTYEYDIEISMDNWGPYSTPTMRLIVIDDVTK
jgi:hypothetical protein